MKPKKRIIKRITRNVLKEINGLTITWRGEKDILVPAIILADWDKGISIKPLDNPKKVRKMFIKFWGSFNARPTSFYAKPKFCLTAYRKEGFEKSSYCYQIICAEISSILNTRETFKRISTGGDEPPVCPHA